MIAFETAVVLMIALVVSLLGRPLAVAYAEKMKGQNKAIDSQESASLKLRIESLENEVRELRGQLKIVQDSADFAVKMIGSTEPESIKKLPKLD